MVQQKDIQIYPLTKEAFVLGCQRWNKMPKNSGNLFTEGSERTLCGFVAEEFIHKNLMPNLTGSEGADIYQWDYSIAGKTFDVKNKCVTSIPTPEYEVSIYQYHIPNCDFFMFTRMKSVNKDRDIDINETITEMQALYIAEKLILKYPNIYLLGIIDKNTFMNKSFVVNKGTMMPNGYRANGTTVNVYIKDMTPVQSLLGSYSKIYSA